MSPKQILYRLIKPQPITKETVIMTAVTYAIPFQELDKLSIEDQVGSIRVSIHYEIVKAEPNR